MPTVQIDEQARKLIDDKQRELRTKYQIDMQVNTLASLAVKAGINKIDVALRIKEDEEK